MVGSKKFNKTVVVPGNSDVYRYKAAIETGILRARLFRDLMYATIDFGPPDYDQPDGVGIVPFYAAKNILWALAIAMGVRPNAFYSFEGRGSNGSFKRQEWSSRSDPEYARKLNKCSFRAVIAACCHEKQDAFDETGLNGVLLKIILFLEAHNEKMKNDSSVQRLSWKELCQFVARRMRFDEITTKAFVAAMVRPDWIMDGGYLNEKNFRASFGWRNIEAKWRKSETTRKSLEIVKSTIASGKNLYDAHREYVKLFRAANSDPVAEVDYKISKGTVLNPAPYRHQELDLRVSPPPANESVATSDSPTEQTNDDVAQSTGTPTDDETKEVVPKMKRNRFSGWESHFWKWVRLDSPRPEDKKKTITWYGIIVPTEFVESIQKKMRMKMVIDHSNTRVRKYMVVLVAGEPFENARWQDCCGVAGTATSVVGSVAGSRSVSLAKNVFVQDVDDPSEQIDSIKVIVRDIVKYGPIRRVWKKTDSKGNFGGFMTATKLWRSEVLSLLNVDDKIGDRPVEWLEAARQVDYCDAPVNPAIPRRKPEKSATENDDKGGENNPTEDVPADQDEFDDSASVLDMFGTPSNNPPVAESNEKLEDPTPENDEAQVSVESSGSHRRIIIPEVPVQTITNSPKDPIDEGIVHLMTRGMDACYDDFKAGKISSDEFTRLAKSLEDAKMKLRKSDC